MLRGINHVVLKVRSLDAADKFYADVLGLQRVGRRGRMQFYSAGAHNHDFAVVELGPRATPPSPASTGLFHLCFDVSDEQSLRRLHEKLSAAGVPVSDGVDHGIQRSFYTQDPDGNTIEFGVDVPRSEWQEPDPFAEDRPYQL